jgi:tetratricopeptide (TPR) repeat protein
MALCQSELGRAFYLRKELTEAEAHYHKALEIYQALGDRSGIINTLIGLARSEEHT